MIEEVYGLRSVGASSRMKPLGGLDPSPYIISIRVCVLLIVGGRRRNHVNVLERNRRLGATLAWNLLTTLRALRDRGTYLVQETA